MKLNVLFREKKMKLFITVFTFVLFAAISVNAQTIRFGNQIAFPISFEDGSGLPPSITLDLNTVFPLEEDGWGLFTSIGLNTGLGLFQPNPQIVIGPTHQLWSSAWSLALTAMYRFIAPVNESDENHIIGLAIVPSHPLVNGDLVIAFPLGPAYNVGLDSWSLAFSVKISFRL